VFGLITADTISFGDGPSALTFSSGEVIALPYSALTHLVEQGQVRLLE